MVCNVMKYQLYGILYFFIKLDCDPYIVPIATTASPKIETFTCSMEFPSSEVVLHLYKSPIQP